MWIREILLAIAGLSAGVAVAGGLFSFIVELGVIAVRLSCGSGSCRKPCVASERLHWVIQLRKPVSPQHANKTILFGFNNLLSGAIFLRRTLCGEEGKYADQ